MPQKPITSKVMDVRYELNTNRAHTGFGTRISHQTPVVSDNRLISSQIHNQTQPFNMTLQSKDSLSLKKAFEDNNNTEGQGVETSPFGHINLPRTLKKTNHKLENRDKEL